MFRELWALFGILMHRIGRVQARVMIFLTYFLVVGPLAILARLSVDPLNLRGSRTEGSAWTPLEPTTRADLPRQF